MLLLSKKDIQKVFTMKDAVEADKEAFTLFSEGKSVVPLRTNIGAPKYDGAFLFMPSYVEDLECSAIKIVNVFPKNIEKGIPTTPAQVLLIDGKTGVVISVLDGTYVTQLRTGAASGAAFDVLANPTAKKGALIGTGGQAATQLEAMLAVRDLEEVKVYDINLQRTEEFVEKMNEELASYGTRIIAAKSSDEAIEDADMIVTVTPSSKPVFDGNKVKAGATVSCVGSYQPHMQEMDSVILQRAGKIYFDSEEAVLSEAGDILIPLADGLITKEDFTGDLGDVLLGKVVGRETEEEIIVFKTVGIGTQDLVTAKHIYDKAVEQGIGTEWNS
ncbi:alanine dehydrogenase [Lachnospiraceae bacterium 2_1_46FAA]|nr:alanine dehydrogenase [Lachnospiraceae bacterium 2_1_46FAA]